MKLKNPVVFTLFLIFFIVNTVDIITAYYIIPGESNPIVLLTGSMSVLAVFKVLFMIGVWFIYKRNIYSSHFNYFGFILIITLGIFIIGLGAYSNIMGIQNPELVEDAAAIPPEERQKMYFTLISVIYIIPIVLSLITFKLYEKSVNNISVQKPKRVWPWQKRY